MIEDSAGQHVLHGKDGLFQEDLSAPAGPIRIYGKDNAGLLEYQAQ